jgi:hypothetical protein
MFGGQKLHQGEDRLIESLEIIEHNVKVQLCIRAVPDDATEEVCCLC